MPLALLTIAEDAPSKTPFYIAGILFACWAVLLAFIGLTRSNFPGSRTGEGIVIGISVVLAAAALGTAIVTGSTEKPEAKGATRPKVPAGERPAAKPNNAPPAQANNAPPGNGGAQAPLAIAADPTGQLRYDKKALKAAAGKVTVDFTNASQVGHDFTVAQGTTKVGGTKVITNSKASATLDLKPGQYVFYCSVPGHRQAGMQGTLTVT
jgi:plastocyanin